MEKRDPIGIIYWGTRGGGNRFTFNLCMEMLKLEVPFVVSLSASNENLLNYKKTFPNQIQTFECDTEFPSITLTYLNRKSKIRDALKSFEQIGVKNIVITMPHFLDLNVFRQAKRNSIFVTRVIHDYKRHPGDIWPNFVSIVIRRYASDKLVYLSRFVQKKCKFPYRRSIVARFPEEHLLDPQFQETSKFESCDVLIIGRIRKYKGLQVLGDVVNIINETTEVNFLLAGNGKTKIKEGKNLVIVERWLAEAEFEELFLKTRIILLLHQEASQSGVPSVATANGKWIVAPELGGLAEQVENGVNGFRYQKDDMNSLKEAIFDALRMDELGVLPTRANSESFSMSLLKFLELDNIL
jgi:glycosyltransferase involved in cell wall biosynthesis